MMTFATDTKGFKVHKSYITDTVNKISISGLSTIPESQDDMLPINEKMIVSADKRIAQHIRRTSGYRNVLLFWK